MEEDYYRVLLRVERVDVTHRTVTFVIPAYNPTLDMVLPFEEIPAEITEFLAGQSSFPLYLHARVNICNPRPWSLNFHDWETR